MYTTEERERHSDYLKKHGITEQKDIDGVLNFIYTIASVAVDIAVKENKHPEQDACYYSSNLTLLKHG